MVESDSIEGLFKLKKVCHNREPNDHALEDGCVRITVKLSPNAELKHCDVTKERVIIDVDQHLPSEKQSACIIPLLDGDDKMKKLWRRCSFLPGEGGRNEPLYGELNGGSMYKVFQFLCNRCRFNEESSFLDIGSGLGKVVFLAALFPGVTRSTGIEISEFRYFASLQLKCVLEDKYKYDLHNVNIIHGDVANWNRFDATHVYAFFVRMDNKCFPHKNVAKAFMRSSKCRYMINFTPYCEMVEYGYVVRLVDSMKVSSQGKGSSKFMLYVYEKC